MSREEQALPANSCKRLKVKVCLEFWCQINVKKHSRSCSLRHNGLPGIVYHLTFSLNEVGAREQRGEGYGVYCSKSEREQLESW